MSKCIIDGCEGEQSSIKHELCRGHLVKMFRTGKVDNKPLRKKRTFVSAKKILESALPESSNDNSQ
jgi:hypothetical protein